MVIVVFRYKSGLANFLFRDEIFKHNLSLNILSASVDAYVMVYIYPYELS
jgi:hypothetical protein